MSFYAVIDQGFEIGINLKGEAQKVKLEAINSVNAMCSHKINVTDVKDIDTEVMQWLKAAYESAG